MANEVEASELAVGKEDLANEEASHGESTSAGVPVGDAAEGSTEPVTEVSSELKTGTDVMSQENEKQNLEETKTKESVIEKETEMGESFKLAEGDSEIVEKSDSEVVKEEVKESVLETKTECASGSEAATELKAEAEPVSSEEKSADESVAEVKSVSKDKQAAAGEEKSGDEAIAEAEPVQSDKPAAISEEKSGDEPGAEATPIQNDKQIAADEPVTGASPAQSDKPAETGGGKPADKPVVEAATASSDKTVLTEKEKSAGEVKAEPKPILSDKKMAAGEEKPPDEPAVSEKPEVTGEPKSAKEVTADAGLVSGDEEVSKPELVRSDKPEPEVDEEPSHSLEVKPEDEEKVGLEPVDQPEVDDEPSNGLEQKPRDDDKAEPELVDEPEVDEGPEAEGDSEDEEKEVVQDEENNEEKIEKPLDDDQDRRNPQYIPKGGAFYEHDNRTSLEDVENKDPQENEKKKKSWKESKDSEEWLHDCYNESEQQPKSTAEIIETYGYDIRRDDAPPRARRRRKYGRGPDKYERSWEDEQAYQIKQSNIGRRGKKKLFGKDEFPPLPNQKSESSVSKPVHKSSIRKKEEVEPKSVNVKLNGNEKPPAASQAGRPSHSGNHNNVHGFNPSRKSYPAPNKKINDSDIKPFRNDDGKWKMPFKHGKQDDYPKPIKMQSVRHTEPPFKRSVEANKNSTKDPHMSHITEGINQMTFVNQKQADMRDIRVKANGPEESKISEAEVDNPANRQNPKRYSKIRKGFTGIFPPEEVPELDQSELHKLQQEQQKSQHLNMTQPLNMQNVMKRYAGTYGNLSNCVSDFVPGNSSYLQARPIISAIPQQALSPQGIHQQALSPQGIPQQALSPQVPGLPTIELQQNPLAQPNFIPQPMYVDPHFTSDVMGPFSGYSPYSGNQTGEVYQPPRGITYYNTESQTTGQKRPPPRRQNAAIPIVPPPE